MRITFVLPFLELTGGIRVFLDLAEWIERAGHRVTVVYPLWPYRFLGSRWGQIGELRHRWRTPIAVPWRRFQPRLVRVPLVRDRFLPDADVVIATAWPTAHDVARLSPGKGTKVYLIMHHETDSGRPAEVDPTYRYSMYRITIAATVRDRLHRDLGVNVDTIVPCGIDPRVFYVDSTLGARATNTVLMLYHPVPRKGASDGLAALTRLRARWPALRVILCGTTELPTSLPSWFERRPQPSDAELRQLYSTATALLYPSRYEGFGLPPLEAMACGCPVVSTKVGAIPELARDRDSALLVEPGDIDGMTERLLRLSSEPQLAAQLGRAGLEVAARYTLDRSGEKFLAALDAAVLRATPRQRGTA